MSLITEILMRQAANYCNGFKQDQFFEVVTFSTFSGTELENACVQL